MKKYLAIFAIVCLVGLVSAAGVFIGALFSDPSMDEHEGIQSPDSNTNDLPNLNY
ncbi:hypothetical protein O1D97_03395 [Marinomonas sp. 15G1-11]|uniref:Uncharacterized protein n=1 Tax=Marinomonas phaeophyticola TaxID=3004091 RepID=A0ABT4JQT5_9GAMM|nr:hypothetical protein [Marinomonas sp. 15G1-11]MCZ2720714.1 hypothetical protein [Marinomonas sp. 15G1-11]